MRSYLTLFLIKNGFSYIFSLKKVLTGTTTVSNAKHLEKASSSNDFIEDGKADLNIDTDGDGKPDLNIDTNGDETPDTNIDLNGDGIPDINIDTNGDGYCNINCDTNENGLPDTNLDMDADGQPDKKVTEDEIDVSKFITREIVFEDVNKDDMFSIMPGWVGSKSFKVTNTSEVDLIYSIYFTNTVNEITEENNLYYGLTKDGVTVISIENTRAPRTSESLLVKNIVIKPHEVHNYTITFEFKDTGLNQDIDKNKRFYTKLQVRNAS